jgi:hypothetical protein
VTTHFTGSSDITVALPPPDAMTLFTPEGERSWAGKDGWNPRYPVPSRTVGAGAVFTTQHQGRLTIWVIVDQQPDRIRYARVTPHGLAGTVEVRALSGSRAATTVHVTYDLTALTDAAADELAGFAAGYHAEIDTWASDIAESLAGRGTVLGVPGSTGRKTDSRNSSEPGRGMRPRIPEPQQDPGPSAAAGRTQTAGGAAATGGNPATPGPLSPMAVPLWADPRFRYASSIQVNEDRPPRGGHHASRHPAAARRRPHPGADYRGRWARRAHEARHAQRRRLAAHLRRSTRPKNVWIVPDMPKTRSGQIMQRVIASVSNFADVGDITTLANPEIVEGIASTSSRRRSPRATCHATYPRPSSPRSGHSAMNPEPGLPGRTQLPRHRHRGPGHLPGRKRQANVPSAAG